MELDELARRSARELREAGGQARFTVRSPAARPDRHWPVMAVASAVALVVIGATVLWTAHWNEDTPGEVGSGTPVTVTPTVASTTTTTMAKTPAASVDDLVTALYAALNAQDDAGFRALSTEDAHHVVYWAGPESAGVTTDFAVATHRLATSGIESIEVLGEPIASGDTVTIPVLYHYPSEGPYVGFDVLITRETEGGLLISGGATILADQSLMVDPTTMAAIEAEKDAWNDNGADAVVANFADGALFWDNLADPNAAYAGEEIWTKVASSMWFDVEITGEPVTSGPFTAVPNRLVGPSDSSEGISIYLIRDGKIVLHGFAQ